LRAQAPTSVAGSRFIAMIFIPEELASLHRRDDHALSAARETARMSVQQTNEPRCDAGVRDDNRCNDAQRLSDRRSRSEKAIRAATRESSVSPRKCSEIQHIGNFEGLFGTVS
jgi:hypothetical protein